MLSGRLKEKCTACGACVSACPQKCIMLEKDEEGFYYPKIDMDQCVNCSICSRVCHLYANIQPKTSEYFAAYSKNQTIRLNGSSGGVFEELSTNVLSNNGVVYGAAFDSNYRAVKHVSTDNVEFSQLRKSKYLESFMGGTFHDIREQLNKGKSVLFCGTPCQVRGLCVYLNELGVRQDKLICVDFLCHGVPSVDAYNRYLYYLEKKYKSTVSEVGFRTKKLGWETYCMFVKFANGREYLKTGVEDPYYRMFFECKNFRKSCYGCTIVKNSSADITLGDLWGNNIEHTDKGVSFVSVNTDKGSILWKAILHSISFKKIDDVEARKHFSTHDYLRDEILNYDFNKYRFSVVRYIKGIVLKNRIGRNLVRRLRR